MTDEHQDLVEKLKALVGKVASSGTTTQQRKQIYSVIDELSSLLQESSLLLDESKRRIRTLVETMPVGIAILSEAGNIEAVNPAFRNLFNYEYKELIGHKFVDLLCGPIEREKIIDLVLRILPAK